MLYQLFFNIFALEFKQTVNAATKLWQEISPKCMYHLLCFTSVYLPHTFCFSQGQLATLAVFYKTSKPTFQKS